MPHSKRASRQIAIVTQAFDPHADELLVLLRYMGQEPLRINTETIPGNALLSYTFSGSPPCPTLEDESTPLSLPDMERYALFIDGRMIEAEQVGAVWWRRTAPYRFIGTLQPEELRLALAETEQAMQGLWLALSAKGCYWVSEPGTIAVARNCLEQLRRARDYGFATPRSLLTTRTGHLRAFYQETGGQVVYRTLSTRDGYEGLTPLGSGVCVGETLLETFEDMVRVPCLFHQRLVARHFLQVVVIGEQVFAAQTTGEVSQVAHWWSSEISTLSYRPARISDDLLRRCRGLVQSYGLKFGVLQLALGLDEQLYFILLDPTGSFLWLEQQCPDLRMAETLAELLIAGVQAEL